MKVATVILNWNGRDMMRQFLPSVVRHAATCDCEVIVADNGSTDGSIEMLESEFQEVKIIKLDKNHGFAKGYNMALKDVDADYYFILNSDVELKHNPLPYLIETIESDDTIAAVAPKILSQREPNMFEYAGAAGGFIDKYGFPFCRGRIIGLTEEDRGQYDNPMEIFWASGAAFFVRSDVYHEHGGFDEDFFAHVEEVDLCWRIKNSGYKIVSEPRAQVFHVGGASLDNSSPFKLYLNYRNTLFMLYKNLHKKERNSIIFRRMLIDGALCGIYLLQMRFDYIKSVIKAHNDFRSSKKLLDAKRGKNERQIKTIRGLLNGSILTNYLFGKRVFVKIEKGLKLHT